MIWTKWFIVGSMNARADAEVSGRMRLAPKVTATNMRPMSVAEAPPARR